MRKFYVLSLMAAGALTASAQTALSPLSVETGQCTMSEYASVYSFSKVATKAPKASFLVLPYEADGLYRCGVTTGTGFFRAAFDIFSGDNIAYLGAATNAEERPEYSWTVVGSNGSTMQLPTNERGTALIKLFGNYNFPILEGRVGDEVASYERASDPDCKAEASYLATQFASELPLSMGDAGFAGGSLYSGFDQTTYFGSGMKNADGEALTGVYSLFNRTTAPIRVYGVTLPITRLAAGDPIPAGVNIDVEIWKVDEEGVLVEMLGSASGSSTECTGDATKGMWTFDVKFVGEDEFGMPVDKPVLIPADTQFAVAVKNVDKANFKVLFVGNPIQGSAYILYGNKVGTIGYTNAPNTPSADMLLSLIADMPSAMWQDKVMNCPVEGGLASVDENQNFAILYTTVPHINPSTLEAEYEIVAPDWVTVGDLTVLEDENGGWEYYRAYALELTASELPSGMNGRQGEVVVKCPGGVEKKFQIGQGEWTPVGIENVATAEASVVVAGDSFQLTYGDEYNSVAVYNVAGAKVASYALPQGGSFEVPAADLNGVYVVVFQGQAKKVVKVVK